MRNGKPAILLALVSAVLLATDAPGDDSKKITKKTRPNAELLKKAAAIAAKSDSAEACAFLEKQGDPVAVADLYANMVRHQYFARKDVASMVVFGRAGIQYSLTEARRRRKQGDKRGAATMTGHAKTIAYNLGANTWPGWNDRGITINRTDLAIGLDAARVNLRLGTELKRKDSVIANAHWLLGAHRLAAGQYEAAVTQFTKSAAKSRAAKTEDAALMADAYAALARLAATPKSAPAEKRFEMAVKALAGHNSKNAQFFVKQLATAKSIFVK